MPGCSSYDYAVVRVVPRVERQEFVNIGVIVHCPERKLLEARVHVDEARLQALWPGIDVALIRLHAEAVMRICAGDEQGGPIARLSQRERFHWLTSPRSTIMQTSAPHTGVCQEPAGLVDRLFEQMVLVAEGQ